MKVQVIRPNSTVVQFATVGGPSTRYAAAGVIVGGVDVPDTRIVLRGVPAGTVFAMGGQIPPGDAAAQRQWITDNFPRTTAWRANIHAAAYVPIADVGLDTTTHHRHREPLADIVLGARANTPQWLAIAEPGGPVRVIAILLSSEGARDLTDLWRALGDGSLGFVGFAPRAPGLPAVAPTFLPGMNPVPRTDTPAAPLVFSGLPGLRTLNMDPLGAVSGSVRVDASIYYELTVNPFGGVVAPGDGAPAPLAGPAVLVIKNAPTSAAVSINGQPAMGDQLRYIDPLNGGPLPGNAAPSRESDIAVRLTPNAQSEVRVSVRQRIAVGGVVTESDRTYAYPVTLGPGLSRDVTLDGSALQYTPDTGAVLRFTVVGAPAGSTVKVNGTDAAPVATSSNAMAFMWAGGVSPDGSVSVTVTAPSGASQTTVVRQGGSVTWGAAPPRETGIGGTLIPGGLFPGQGGPAPGAQTAAHIDVMGAPDGSVVDIARDGVVEQQRVVSQGGTATYRGVLLGPREVRVTAPNGEVRAATITVQRNFRNPVQWSEMAVVTPAPSATPPPPPPARWGTVRVEGLPAGATLTADRAPDDAPPASRDGTTGSIGVAEGERTITVTLPNGEVRTARVTVAAGERATIVFATMRVERPADPGQPPAEGPPAAGTVTIRITQGQPGAPVPPRVFAQGSQVALPLTTLTTDPTQTVWEARGLVPGTYTVNPGCGVDEDGRTIEPRLVLAETPGRVYTVTFNCAAGGQDRPTDPITPPSAEGDIVPDPNLPPNRGRLIVLRAASITTPVMLTGVNPPAQAISMPPLATPGSYQSILTPGLYLIDGGVGEPVAANVSAGFTSTVRLTGGTTAPVEPGKDAPALPAPALVTPVVQAAVASGRSPTDAAASTALGMRANVALPKGVIGRTAEGFRRGPIVEGIGFPGAVGVLATEFSPVPGHDGAFAFYDPKVGMVAGRVTEAQLAGLKRLWTPLSPSGFDGYGMER